MNDSHLKYMYIQNVMYVHKMKIGHIITRKYTNIALFLELFVEIHLCICWWRNVLLSATIFSLYWHTLTYINFGPWQEAVVCDRPQQSPLRAVRPGQRAGCKRVARVRQQPRQEGATGHWGAQSAQRVRTTRVSDKTLTFHMRHMFNPGQVWPKCNVTSLF